MDQRSPAGGTLPPIAGRLRRVCARLVDLVLAFGTGGALVALCEPLTGATGPVVAGWLVPPLYEIVGSATGGTLGKRVFGLRIAAARAPHHAPSFGALAARALTMLPLMAVWAVNLLAMAVDRTTARAIHDMIAGTVVCHTGAAPGSYGTDVAHHDIAPREAAPGVAGPGVRIAARLVDLLICAVVAIVAATAVERAGNAAVAATLILAGPVYELGFAYAAGTTPGKRLFRLRVRRVAEPGPVPRATLALRALVLWGLVLLPCLAGAVWDLMALLRDPSRRAVHDLGRTTVCHAAL